MILWLCIISFLFLNGFAFYFYRALKNYVGKAVVHPPYKKGVSVIIAVKNEAATIRETIQNILHQDFPLFELIVIDDYSEDESYEAISSIKDPRLKALKAEGFDNIPGKKAAITFAIQQAQYEVLLFTDADCQPASDYWISKMTAHFVDPNTKVVLGYGPYMPDNTFLNKFIRYETFVTAINYMSFALKMMPYMGVGRNLAYRKSFFVEQSGFSDHKHIASGDDDLLIAKAGLTDGVNLELSPETFCYSKAKTSWKSYIHQKQRHVSTSTSYSMKHKLLLSLYVFFHFFFFFSAFLLLFSNFYWLIAVSLMAVNCASRYGILKPILLKFGEKDLTTVIYSYDIIFICYYFISLPGVFTSKQKPWK